MTNQQLHSVLLDSTCYSTKPKSNSIGAITNRLKDSEVSITISALADALVAGRTWTPATFNGGARTNANFYQSSLVAIDVDNKEETRKKGKKKVQPKQVKNPVTFQMMLDRCMEYGLLPAFAYKTFSHTDTWERYRVVFQLETPVTCYSDWKSIGEFVKHCFPESDDTFDGARLFFGGKDELLFQGFDNVITVNGLKEMALTHGLDLDKVSKKNQAAKVARRYKAVTGETLAFDGNPDRPEVGRVHEVDFEMIAKNVRIFSEFVNGSKLLHPQLVGLASNLTPLRGGLDLFCQKLKENPAYADDKVSIAIYAKKQRWFPQPLGVYSPYTEDAPYINLERAAQVTAIRRIEPKPVYTLTHQQGRELMPGITKRLIEDTHTPDGKFLSDYRLYKVPTGLGKTHSICEYIAHNSCGQIVYALPTHALKKEAVERILGMNPDAKYEMTPDPKEYLHPEDYSKYQMLMNSGKRTDGAYFIKKLAEKDWRVQEFLDEQEFCFRSKRPVITTHHMAIHVGDRFTDKTTYIFDEDPTNTLMPIDELKISEIEKLRDLPGMPPMARENLDIYLNSIRGSMRGGVYPVMNPFPTKDIAKKAYELYARNRDAFATPIWDMFSSSLYKYYKKIIYDNIVCLCYDIKFIKKNLI